MFVKLDPALDKLSIIGQKSCLSIDPFFLVVYDAQAQFRSDKIMRCVWNVWSILRSILVHALKIRPRLLLCYSQVYIHFVDNIVPTPLATVDLFSQNRPRQ